MAGRDPPSVRTVLGLLNERPRLTGAQLRVVSGLPRRTVYQALRVLCDRGTVLHRTSLRDSRQTYYWLNQAPSREVEPASGRAVSALFAQSPQPTKSAHPVQPAQRVPA